MHLPTAARAARVSDTVNRVAFWAVLVAATVIAVANLTGIHHTSTSIRVALIGALIALALGRFCVAIYRRASVQGDDR